MEAGYMHKKMKLYLKRYSIIWILEQLERKMSKLKDIIEKSNDKDAKELFITVTMKYMDYKAYLRAQ